MLMNIDTLADLTAALDTSGPFAALSEEDRVRLVTYLQQQTYEAGERILQEGGYGRSMYFVVRGKARILHRGMVVGEVDSGGYFGELGLIADLPRAASVDAVTPLTVGVLHAHRYEQMSLEDPRLALSMAQTLMRSMRGRLAMLTESVRQQVVERSVPRRMTVKVTVGSHVHEVTTGTAVGELLPRRVDERLVVAALVNRRAKSLVSRLSADCVLEPLTTGHWEGQLIFKRSLGLLLLEAAREVDPTRAVFLDYSVGKGRRVRVEPAPDDPVAFASELQLAMDRIVARDQPLREEWWMVDEARAHFEAVGWFQAAEALLTRYDPAVRLIPYGDLYVLRAGPVVPRTGLLRGSQVLADGAELLLLFGEEGSRPGRQSVWPGSDSVANEVRSAARQTDQMTKDHRHWLRTLGITSVGEFNRACIVGSVPQLIRVSEGFQEKRLSRIADAICSRRDAVKVVSVAGPSSSGKSTFIRRLIVQLQVNGMNPVGLGIDDYYVDRDASPVDEDGEYDFESFDAIRSDLLSEHFRRLLQGERVRTARFDFKSGKSLPAGGPELCLGPRDLLIVEGIHGLNPRLLEAVPSDQAFRVFLCPLSMLPIDRLSRVKASDLRLLRRIVRDRHGRETSPEDTILRWASVRRGERRHIFPYQREADAVFDSSLIYELSVLRVFAERYLLEVPPHSPALTTAHRLLTLVDRFIPIYPDHVPPTSILREFIGNSGFEY